MVRATRHNQEIAGGEMDISWQWNVNCMTYYPHRDGMVSCGVVVQRSNGDGGMGEIMMSYR